MNRRTRCGGDEAEYNASGLAYFRRGDWLGSARVSSTPTGTVHAARAYAPYGAPYDESGGYADRDFTGAKQDIASRKYDFTFRVYAPVMGRWFTPDPSGLAAVDPNNPQTWNRYAYVSGNPLAFVDPLGLEWSCVETVSGITPIGLPICDLDSGGSDAASGGAGSHPGPRPEQPGESAGGANLAPATNVSSNSSPHAGWDIRSLLQCAVDRTEAAGPGSGIGKLLLGNTIPEVVGLALQATATYGDVGQAMASAAGVGVVGAAGEQFNPALNAAGNALVRGFATLQESGNVTQLGLTSVIEESAPEILSLAGRNFVGGIGGAKFAFDALQFAYEIARCW